MEGDVEFLNFELSIVVPFISQFVESYGHAESSKNFAFNCLLEKSGVVAGVEQCCDAVHFKTKTPNLDQGLEKRSRMPRHVLKLVAVDGSLQKLKLVRLEVLVGFIQLLNLTKN